MDTISLLLFVLLQLISFAVPQPDFVAKSCIDTSGNYSSNSAYESNLNTVLSEISSNTEIDYGFYNFSVGQEPDRADGIGLCRGDVEITSCHSCLNESIHKLKDVCPTQREAIGWYEYCMLRYSNRSIFGVREDTPPNTLVNVNNASDVDQFSSVLGTLLGNLQTVAASGDSRLKFATGEGNVTAFLKVYALLQCTPDLSYLDCINCLGGSINNIPSCCGGKQGAGIYKPSCNLRYEIYQFYKSGDASPPAQSSPPTSNSEKKGKSSKVVIAVVVFVVASAIIVSAFLFFCKKRRRKTGMTVISRLDTKEEISSRIDTREEISSTESLQFDFSTVAAATDNFSEPNKLGIGGFGAVYKGRLSNGNEIAVKRLARNSGQGEKEFKNEVVLLAKLQHRNLVRLQGFCLEGEERLLIYEFVPNKSLDYFLFDAIRHDFLNSQIRFKIIGGIARGLLYLHEDSRLRIIHRDLKASNILLDSDMNPKISDFGLAKLFQVDQTHADTGRIVGTYGYMAPEYALHGLFSVKSDIYSFGVLVLEILSGRRNVSFYGHENVENLMTLMWRHWREGTALDVVDPKLLAGSRDEILRCLHIGLLCIQEREADRPSISSVVLMLSSHSSTLPEPFQPAFVGYTTSSTLSY